MNQSSAAFLGLRQLVVDLDATGQDLTAVLVELTRSLTAAVPTYAGLRLTLDLDGSSVTLTTLDPAELESLVTSLRWWLTPIGGAQEAHLTLYAYRAGALVDLAADIAWVAQQRTPDLLDPPESGFEVHLDQHLPPPVVAPGLDGLERLSVLNRAAGILIDRGVPAEQALAELSRRAAASGLEVHLHARAMLDGESPA